MEYLWNHYFNDPSDGAKPYCSLIAALDASGPPPWLIVCAEFDPLCDDGRNYAAMLEEAGAPAKFRLNEGMIHGFLWMSGVYDQSRTLLDEIGREVGSARG